VGVAPGTTGRATGRTGFGADLRRELRRVAREPGDDVWALVINGLLVCAGWLVLPAAARAWLFTLQGPIAFAVVLETWMLSDVPSTNPLANDAAATVAALPDRGALEHLIRVKTVALAVLIGPVSAAACLVIAVLQGRYAAGVALAIVLLVLPFGVVPLAAGLGTLLPYHPRALRWRWSNRRPWRRTVRWGVLIVAPYVVVPVIAVVFVLPSLLLGLWSDHGSRDWLSGWQLVLTTGLSCLLIACAFALAPRLIAGLAGRRATALQAYLSDVDRG